MIEFFVQKFRLKKTWEDSDRMRNELSKISIYHIGLSFSSLVMVTLLVKFTIFSRNRSKINFNQNICHQMINENGVIQEEKINQLSGKEGVKKSVIREILGEPYCVLPKASIRAGVITEREAYKISEDAPLIIAYEEDQYLGYGLVGNTSGKYQAKGKQIELHKLFGIETGEVIAGQRVIGGLGDISLELNGSVKAPVPGVVDSKFVLVTEENLIDSTRDCVIFSSPQMPAYLLKICGLKERNLGVVDRGSPIGKTGGKLHIALLSFRKVTNKTSKWIYISPSKTLIEKLVQ